jgi:two-component system sensor histidine kinase AlgZ
MPLWVVWKFGTDMHPILSHLRRLFLFQAGLMLVGILLAWFLVDMHFASWAGALLFALPVLQVYGFILTSAYYVSRSQPFSERTAFKILSVFGGAALFSSLAWLGFCFLWNSLSHNVGLDWAGIQFTNQVAIFIFCIGCVLYVMSLLAHDVLIAFENIREAERQQAATQVLARDAELQLLRSQINPHFLFNSLNSISALTTFNAEAARAMTIELGDFFRKTLAVSERKMIPLTEEIALCEHFLAIEKIRFGEKLITNFDIQDSALGAQVPPMFLQPLVENAIKHGIYHLSHGGTINLVGIVKGARLHLEISNPTDVSVLVSAINKTQGTGTGLKNLKARFENIYGAQAKVSWQLLDNIFSVNIQIPLETVPQAEVTAVLKN